MSIIDPTHSTPKGFPVLLGDDIQDAETTKNVELIQEMKVKLQQLYLKQNEIGLLQRPNTQTPANNTDNKAFFPATPGSRLTRESSFFNDLKSPSYESPYTDNSQATNSSRKTFFPY